MLTKNHRLGRIACRFWLAFNTGIMIMACTADAQTSHASDIFLVVDRGTALLGPDGEEIERFTGDDPKLREALDLVMKNRPAFPGSEYFDRALKQTKMRSAHDIGHRAHGCDTERNDHRLQGCKPDRQPTRPE